MNDLISRSACEVVDLLNAGEVTPLDLLDALEARIGDVDSKVNALPTLCFERAREHAARLGKRPVSERGRLAGLPVPIKDLSDVAGVRSTNGSLIFKHTIPETSDILVENLEAHGGVIYAKSNTPEFGAGANTFNDVFGSTLNPWNTSRSAAGSSGGAAAALAAGMAWVAHGSDMGGSLRNPASFCGVSGMRPSPGRVAATPGGKVDSNLGQEGPMGRTVEDLALLFDAMVGGDPRDPVSLPGDGTCFLDAARSGWQPRRVAVSRDLGISPVDPVVSDIVMAAARRLEGEGVIVEEVHPDLREAAECFHVLRALSFAIGLQPLLESHRDVLKPDIVWNIEEGLKLTAEQIIRAEHQRANLFRRTMDFFQTYDLLLCPATIVPPFPVAERYVTSCNGHDFDNYIQWLTIVSAITLTCCPAISIPAGFTSDKMPVGVQIVAPVRAEARLLAGARMMESLLGAALASPIDPRPGS